MRPRIVPNTAIIPPTIQKRITTVDSFHPDCSKWWCSGAILKTFLLKNFFEISWIITDAASTTKINPIIMRVIVCPVSMAITPNVAPSARDPVSPI